MTQKTLAYHEDQGGWGWFRDVLTNEEFKLHPDYNISENLCEIWKSYFEDSPEMFTCEMLDGKVRRVIKGLNCDICKVPPQDQHKMSCPVVKYPSRNHDT